MKKNIFLALTLALCILCAAACADTYTAGTYTAEAKGFGEGMVTVTMTFDAENITDVQAEGATETAGIGSVAIETLPARILEAQSANVDTVAGCTFSSKAVLMAAADCVAQAKGETVSYEVKMAPGTYVGQGLGFRISEMLTVTVTVNETEIVDIVVDQVNTSEKAALLQTVVDRMIPRMIENQSVSVDAICGATASSNGVRQAVEAAVTEALIAGGSDPAAIAAFYKQPAKNSETIELNTQVLVIGMGGSGTSSALSAAENGLQVLAIDKAGKWGGTSTLVSGPMSINPPSQVATQYEDKAAGEDLIDAEALYTAWTEYTTDNTGVQQAKTEFIRMMMDESGYTTDWLSQYGFAFDRASTFAGNSWPAFTPLSGGKALTEGFYTEAYDHFTAMGGQYMLETEGYELIYDADANKVTGAKARSMVDGTEYVIHADAVILATGGFAGSAEMEERYLENTYFPLKGSWKLFGMHQNDGKMIQSAIDNGAGTYNISVAPMVHVGGVDGFLPGFETVPVEGAMGYATGRPAVWSQGDMPLNMAITSNTLAVGGDAKRFTSETQLSMFNPWISGPHFYSIWGNDQVENLKVNGFSEVPYGPSCGYLGYGTSIPAGVPMDNADAVIEAAISAGYMFKADTIEELAAKMGLDGAALADTVARYNTFCETGVDEEFGKAAEKLVPVTGSCYYGIVGSSWCYSTCGGLDVNTSFQVLKADHETPMGGLYAVGTDCCGVLFSEHTAYVTYGGAAHGFALTSGRLVGGYVAEELKAE